MLYFVCCLDGFSCLKKQMQRYEKKSIKQIQKNIDDYIDNNELNARIYPAGADVHVRALYKFFISFCVFFQFSWYRFWLICFLFLLVFLFFSLRFCYWHGRGRPRQRVKWANAITVINPLFIRFLSFFGMVANMRLKIKFIHRVIRIRSERTIPTNKTS